MHTRSQRFETRKEAMKFVRRIRSLGDMVVSDPIEVAGVDAVSTGKWEVKWISYPSEKWGAGE